MPIELICCVTLPPATIFSVPIYDFVEENKELTAKDTETYFACCGKSICKGCVYSFECSGNDDKCPFCNSDRSSKTREEDVEDLMKRVVVNDPASICVLANHYHLGRGGLQQDYARAIELYARAAELGFSKAHIQLGNIYHEGGNMKKAKSHNEAAAMAGNEVARCILGNREAQSGNMERAVKHWTIAASAGDYDAMHNLLVALKKGYVSTESIDSTLTAYNNSCAEMRSEARDARIKFIIELG
jgi:TPR repeat protein